MAYTEVTCTGWLGQMGNAIRGVVVGLIFFLLSFIVIFWNEGRAVHAARTLEEGKSSVISIDSAKVDPANEGKLVHFSAKAINASGEKLVDPVFHMAQDAIHLRREVEMYQWKQKVLTETHKDALGGGQTESKTYSYSKVWNAGRIDSSEFKEHGHSNPDQWRLASNTIDADPVTAGAFTLSQSLSNQINRFTPVSLTPEIVDGLSADLRPDTGFSNNTLFISNETGRKPDPGSSEIGDLKVSFSAALPGEVSVIAMQTGSSLAPYQKKNNPIELLYVGDHSANEMFKSEEEKNTKLTWILRGVGLLMMWMGLGLILNPFKAMADVVGIIGDIVGAGIALVAGVVAVSLSLITIAVAWISYRPVVGISLFAIAAAVIAGVFVLRSKGAARRGS